MSISIYERLILISCVLVAVIVAHWCVFLLWRWRWPNGERPLPSLLVFPRIEIILAVTTVMGCSEVRGHGAGVVGGLGAAAVVLPHLGINGDSGARRREGRGLTGCEVGVACVRAVHRGVVGALLMVVVSVVVE
jgi:hypothetical protein